MEDSEELNMEDRQENKDRDRQENYIQRTKRKQSCGTERKIKMKKRDIKSRVMQKKLPAEIQLRNL